MSRTKLSMLFSAVTALALLLGACGSAATTAAPATPQTIEVTRIVAGTPETIVITATPVPVTPEPTELPAGSVQINGAGATFPLPVYTEWTYAYGYVDPSVVINYQGIGSGGGKKAIVDNTVDFAGSDSLLKEEEYAAGKDLQMYPMLAGAIVPIYNIEGITQTITLDRQILVDIYLGKINKWSDPVFAKLNPDLKFPDKGITVVHRSDGSGTTEAFTRSLAAFDSVNWVNKDGKPNFGSSIEWAVDQAGNGVGGKGNAGVAAAVQNTKNSIGYVELSYAVSNAIPFAKMVNKAGKTVTANAESLQSAMSDFAGSFTDRLTNNIQDGGGEKTWPIATYTYIILHTTGMQDCTKATKLVEFLNWALTDPAAAKRAASLGYAVLPSDVQAKVLSKLGEVACNGRPVMTK